MLDAPQLFIRQQKNWVEILTDFEARNKYVIFDNHNKEAGMILESSGGFMGLLTRFFLKTHRPFEMHVKDMQLQSQLVFRRKFFWFFSDIEVYTAQGVRLGSAHRRFSILRKKYELRDSQNQTFAHINSSIFRLWTFAVQNLQGKEVAKITKKWGGVMREMFTTADTFMVDFGSHKWKAHERAVLFATAMSIDLDFFDDQGS